MLACVPAGEVFGVHKRVGDRFFSCLLCYSPTLKEIPLQNTFYVQNWETVTQLCSYTERKNDYLSSSHYLQFTSQHTSYCSYVL